DADAHRDERKLVETHALWQAGRRDIVRPIGGDERDAALLDEICDVDVPAGEARGVGPGTERRAALPPARVKQDDVARRDLHALHSFQRLEIRSVDRRSGLEPPLRGGLAGQPRGVEQDGPCHYAIFQGVDAAAWTAASRLDLLH